MSSEDASARSKTGARASVGGDPRLEPARRRRIAVTAAVLALVAVGFYVAFILFTAAHG